MHAAFPKNEDNEKVLKKVEVNSRKHKSALKSTHQKEKLFPLARYFSFSTTFLLKLSAIEEKSMRNARLKYLVIMQ